MFPKFASRIFEILVLSFFLNGKKDKKMKWIQLHTQDAFNEWNYQETGPRTTTPVTLCVELARKSLKEFQLTKCPSYFMFVFNLEETI